MTASLVAVTWFYPDQTGFLDFSYRLRALAEEGNLVVIARAPVTQPELLIPGVRYEVIATPDARRGRLWFYGARVLARMRRLQPDRVVFLASQLAFLAAFWRGAPALVYWNEHPSHFYPEEHAHWWVRAYCALGRRLAYRGARRAARVMPIGEAQRDELLERGCDPARVRLHYLGVDAAFSGAAVASATPASEPLRLIYIGSISPDRGRDVMLQALALVNRDAMTARLTLVGASPAQKAACLALARELGVEGALRVLERIPGTEVPALLKEADYGLCLWRETRHWRFNPPTKLFEYLAAGLPTLASDIRTHTRYVRHGENGWIFTYDALSLAEVIRLAAARKAALPAMRRAAQASAAPHLWPAIRPAFLETVREAATP